MRLRPKLVSVLNMLPVTRALAQLVEFGLLEVKRASDDQRRKIVSLSTNGRRLVEVAKRDVWPRIESAVIDLCADLSGPLLDQLGVIEDGLVRAPPSLGSTARGGVQELPVRPPAPVGIWDRTLRPVMSCVHQALKRSGKSARSRISRRYSPPQRITPR